MRTGVKPQPSCMTDTSGVRVKFEESQRRFLDEQRELSMLLSVEAFWDHHSLLLTVEAQQPKYIHPAYYVSVRNILKAGSSRLDRWACVSVHPKMQCITDACMW